jgi:translation elongation factor P/translation initiation factor 5A
MKNPTFAVPALLAALMLAAPLQATAAPEAKAKSEVTTQQKGSISPTGDAAISVTVSTITAKVESIDMASRLVSLVGQDGKSFSVKVDEKVRNLAQVKAGDRVEVDFYEGVLAELNPPGSPASKEITVSETAARAAPGERPGAALGSVVSAVVEIEFVDTLRNVVSFKGPLGKTRVLKVQKPEFKKMLKKIKAGDKVTVAYFEALAISVKPAK